MLHAPNNTCMRNPSEDLTLLNVERVQEKDHQLLVGSEKGDKKWNYIGEKT